MTFIEELLTENFAMFQHERLQANFYPFPIICKLPSSMIPNNGAERVEMSQVPYVPAVRSLMYVMICTKPNIAQEVRVISKFMKNSGGEHCSAITRILRYTKETLGVAIRISCQRLC